MDMELEKEFIKVIEFLQQLGYSREQIHEGVQKLDDHAYSGWNTNLVIADIIKNIEQGDKE